MTDKPAPAPVGYSGKRLIEKLGLKPGGVLAVIDPPAHYAQLVAPLPDGARVVEGLTPDLAILHLFVADRAGLQAWASKLQAALPMGSALWISWPKRSSPKFVDLTENDIRTLVLPTGLVDVKVAAVDEDWSGLKFLRRKT